MSDPVPTSHIRIQRGFADQLRPEVASIYDEAFGAKLRPALGDGTSRIGVLAAGFQPDHSFIALEEDVLVDERRVVPAARL